MSYHFSKQLSCSWFEALDKTNAALANHGFGVLTIIDVKATLKKKIDKDVAPYTILGACHPKLASEALEAEPHIGVFMPCNVILREVDGGVEVSAVDMVAAVTEIDNPALTDVFKRANTLLEKVVEEI